MYWHNTGTELNQMTETEKQFYSKLKATYLDTTLADWERRHRIYNLCIKEWTAELSDEERKERCEVNVSRIQENGSLTPDEQHPIKKRKNKE